LDLDSSALIPGVACCAAVISSETPQAMPGAA